MEYYLYISESKVNMLFPQIPEAAKGKLGAEVGVNVGVLKATVKAEKESQSKDNLIVHLQAVVDYLKKSEEPGSVDKPKSWIEDTLSARVIYLAENNQVVFFIGTSPGGTRFALGGSAANLLSHQKPEQVQIGWSFLPDLIQSLRAMVSVSEEKRLSQESIERFLSGTAESNEFECDGPFESSAGSLVRDNHENQVFGEEAFVRGTRPRRDVRSPRYSPLCGDGSVNDFCEAILGQAVPGLQSSSL